MTETDQSNWATAQLRILETVNETFDQVKIFTHKKLSTSKVKVIFGDYRNCLGGSHKGPFVSELLSRAIRSAHLRSGMTVLIPSSGNTAIAVAEVIKKLAGVSSLAIVPETMAKAKTVKLQHMDCQTISVTNIIQATQYAVDLAATEPGDYYVFDQFCSESGILFSDRTIASGTFDRFPKSSTRVSSLTEVFGTCGTGVTAAAFAEYKMSKGCEYMVVGVDITGGNLKNAARDHKEPDLQKPNLIEGINTVSLPDSFNNHSFEKILEVEQGAAIATCHFAERFLNLDIGPSSGLVLYAALRRQQELISRSQEGVLFVPIYDSAENYRETIFCPQFLAKSNIVMEPTLNWLMEVFFNDVAKSA